MTPTPNLKTYTLQEVENHKIYGRTDETQNPLPLFFNGSGIEVNVTGTELWIDIDVDYDTHEPWIWTALNGAFMSRQMQQPELCEDSFRCAGCGVPSGISGRLGRVQAL